MSSKEEPRSLEHGKSTGRKMDRRHRALTILARMIAEAYLEEVSRKRLAEIGVKPRLYVETIKIIINSSDVNSPTEREKLHASIDEAIDAATFDGWRANSPPYVLKKDGLSITLKG